MRLLSVLLIAVSACSRGAPPTRNISNHDPASKPAAIDVVENSTGLSARSLESPIAKLGVRFSAPDFGEQIAVAAPRVYEVCLELGVSELMPSSIEVALDGGRPRKLVPPQLTIPLGQLLAVGEELRPGEHWLFAAPVLISGFVPRPGPEAPRLAIARRFSIGSGESSSASGVIWVRRPEGTYNGRVSAAQVVFDVFAFQADGAASNRTPLLLLQGPEHGALRLPAPFELSDLPRGDYEVRASAPALADVSVGFTVNHELGEGS